MVALELTAPLAVIGGEDGWVKQLYCQKMRLGEPDDGGRRRPIPIPGSEFTIDVDIVVIAVGNGANELLTSTSPTLALNRWGNILADVAGRTNLPGVFAGGDTVIGAATVIEAAGAGKRAAAAIHEFLDDADRTWPTP
jgi:glutamate synthase (NADPH/NADH) small chain